MSLQITTDKEPTHTTNSNLNQKLTDKSKHMPQSPFLIYSVKETIIKTTVSSYQSQPRTDGER